MCVNSNDIEDQTPFHLQNLTLDATSNEVYLGSTITNSVKFVDDVNADIKSRQINIVKYFSFLRCNRNAPVYIKIKVLDACILYSLLYNAETWACAKFEHLEVIYRRMLKSIIGVGMTVCNEFLYIELGTLSIKTRVTIKQWRFWKNVVEMSNDNPLVYIINQARKYKLKEVIYYDNLLKKYKCVEDTARIKSMYAEVGTNFD